MRLIALRAHAQHEKNLISLPKIVFPHNQSPLRWCESQETCVFWQRNHRVGNAGILTTVRVSPLSLRFLFPFWILFPTTASVHGGRDGILSDRSRNSLCEHRVQWGLSEERDAGTLKPLWTGQPPTCGAGASRYVCTPMAKETRTVGQIWTENCTPWEHEVFHWKWCASIQLFIRNTAANSIWQRKTLFPPLRWLVLMKSFAFWDNTVPEKCSWICWIQHYKYTLKYQLQILSILVLSHTASSWIRLLWDEFSSAGIILFGLSK